MATEIGTAYLSIVASTQGMTRDIKKAYGGAEAEGGKSGQRSGGGFLGGLKGTILKAGAVLGVGALVGKTISLGMARATSIEGSTKKLEGLGHSAASVSSIMGSALKSVKGTAYGLGDAATVAASMAASGVKNGEAMTRTLSTVADVAAISGRSLTDVGAIFGSVAARGKLQGDDMLQLTSAGIPVLALLGKHMGKSSEEISKMVSKGQIDFQTFADAMQKGLGGAALKSGETFVGAVANVKAAAGRLGAAFMAPGLVAAKPLLAGLTSVIDAMGTAVTPVAQALSARMVPAAERVGAAMTALAQGKPLGEILGDASPILGIVSALSPLNLGLQAIKPVLPQIGAAFAQVLAALAPAVPALASVAATLGGALAQAIAAVTPAILPVVVTLAELAGKLLSNEPLVMGLVTAFLAFKGVGAAASAIGGVTSAIGAAKDVITTTGSVLGGLRDGFAGLQTIQQTAAGLKAFNLATMASSVASGIATAAQWAWNVALSANPIALIVIAIAALIAGLVLFFTQTEVGKQAWQAFVGFLGAAWQGLVAVATTVWDAIVGAVTGAVAGIQAGWAGLVAGIRAIWSGIEPVITAPLRVWVELFGAIFNTIIAVISGVFLTIVGIFTGNSDLIAKAWKGLGAKLSEIWSGAWNAISSILSNAWNALQGAVSTGINAVVGVVAQLPGRAVAALSALGGMIAGVASSAWGAFSTAASWGISSAIGVISSLPGRAIGALSGIGYALLDAGRRLIEGFIAGIRNAAGAIGNAIRGVVDNAVSAAKNFLGIRSPSRVFAGIGRQTGAGLAAGIGQMVDVVADAAAGLADAAIPDVRPLALATDNALSALSSQVGMTVQSRYDAMATQLPQPESSVPDEPIRLHPDTLEQLARIILNAMGGMINAHDRAFSAAGRPA